MENLRPEIYHHVCDFFIRIKPKNLLVFEDSSNGIIAADNSKAKVIAVSDKNFKDRDNFRKS